MSIDFKIPSPLQIVEHDLFNQLGVEVYMKRDDMIHPVISGNKWRKLKYNIEKFKQGRYDSILTFGGAYSNHIAATASLGNLLEIPTIGIIRGEELSETANNTLKLAHQNGMKLNFVSRDKYKERYEKLYWVELREKFGNTLIIEEGGANYNGLIGCSQIISELPFEPDHIITAAGTGTTAAGLLFGSNRIKVLTVPVFKNGDFIRSDINDLLYHSGLSEELLAEKLDLLDLETRFHFGGYGKHTDELIAFMNAFYVSTKIQLDQVYTAKMVFAFFERLKEGYFKKGAKIVLLHTGGLQGNQSILNRLV